MVLLKLLLSSIFLVLCQGQTLDVDPPEKMLFLGNGDSQELKCSSGGTGDIMWKKPATSVARIRTDGQRSSSLNLPSFNVTLDSGDYTCELKGSVTTSFTVTIVGVEEEKIAHKFEYEGSSQESIKLQCKINFNGKEDYLISGPEWYFGKNRNSLGGDKFDVNEVGNLTIHNPNRKDSPGVYKAKYIISKKDQPTKEYEYFCKVELTADPLVLSFEKSKNLVEGDELDLKCLVLGYPKVKVTWFKNGLELNDSTADLKLKMFNGTENGHLTIKTVDFDNAGDYNCTASSENLMASDNKVIVVRVAGKFAALYPLLGIVGECAVLALVIFISEKRRKSREAAAEAQ